MSIDHEDPRRGHVELRSYPGRGQDRPLTGLPARDRRPRAERTPGTRERVNNRAEADHGRLKARQRSMRGLKRRTSARTTPPVMSTTPPVMKFVQNLRRGRYGHAQPTFGTPCLSAAARRRPRGDTQRRNPLRAANLLDDVEVVKHGLAIEEAGP
jgi:hypothetical protein